MRDGILKRKLNFTCNYRSSGAHGSVKRHFIPKPPCMAAAASPERRVKKNGNGKRERGKTLLSPKMALSRCGYEGEQVVGGVTGK